MASPRDFQRRLEALAARVEANAEHALREASVRAVEALVYGTPVGGPPSSPDDPHPGLAQSNWSIGREAERGVESPVETIARAETAPIVGNEVIISNPLPYIGRLNDGWSAQAPAGFVEAAVDAAAQAVGGVRLLD